MEELHAPRAEDRVLRYPDFSFEYEWILSRRLDFSFGRKRGDCWFDTCGVSPVADDATVVSSGFGALRTDSSGAKIAATWSCLSRASFAFKRIALLYNGRGRRVGHWFCET